MCSCDADYPSVYDVRTRIARKRYACDECHRPIQPGDSYEHVSGCWDDEWNHYRTCRLCVVLRGMAGDPCHTELHECWFESARFGEAKAPETAEQYAAVGWAWGLHYGYRLQKADFCEQRRREWLAKKAGIETEGRK